MPRDERRDNKRPRSRSRSDSRGRYRGGDIDREDRNRNRERDRDRDSSNNRHTREHISYRGERGSDHRSRSRSADRSRYRDRVRDIDKDNRDRENGERTDNRGTGDIRGNTVPRPAEVSASAPALVSIPVVRSSSADVVAATAVSVDASTASALDGQPVQPQPVAAATAAGDDADALRKRRERLKLWQAERARKEAEATAAAAAASTTGTCTVRATGPANGDTNSVSVQQQSTVSVPAPSAPATPSSTATADASLSLALPPVSMSIGMNGGLARSGSEPSFASAIQQQVGNSKRRQGLKKNRLSKWDTAVGTETETSAVTTTGNVTSTAVPVQDPSSSSMEGVIVSQKGTAATASTITASGAAADETVEDDPLDAFMSILYGTGEVENQKELKHAIGSSSSSTSTSNNNRMSNQSGQKSADDGSNNIHGDGAEDMDLLLDDDKSRQRRPENSSSNSSSSNRRDYGDIDDDDDDEGEYDESKFNNFSSNIITLDEIMNMAAANNNSGSTKDESRINDGTGNSYVNSNHLETTIAGIDNRAIRKRARTARLGWESDVASSVGDALEERDEEEDEESFSANDSNRHNRNINSTSVEENKEANNEETSASETESEREARELREKQEFVDAIRRSREEEERVRERWKQNDVAELAEAEAAAHKAEKEKSKDALGRVFAEDGDVMDELDLLAGNKGAAAKGALELLEEAKRGKMLKEIDHSKIEYIPFRKNLYIVPRALSRLTEAQVAEKREELQIKVRGKRCTAPVETWEQCGLSDRILAVIQKYQLKEPFSIQKQAIPAIMCGRDVIGVAKTGSGKTLAFLLPMFRHIQDQPPLCDKEGPIGLIMAPARELAHQINAEARKFASSLGMRVTCIYGGAGVAEQIADLKRGSEIVVCTPGRMIDILCMQAGKMVSLRRVTMVVLDEADRMFDMGFEPQIRMIMQNVRPDRQTVLFSATFPKQIEKLAKSVLTFPLEIVVGERSTVNKDITQLVEVREEEDKFLRLLQLLGLWYEKGSVLVFVDKQEKCDQLFQDLLKLGYPCLSLHGGKEQVDREHTLHEFKTGIKTVMIATSVAGRGLDVPDIVCVVNYNCPNHLEDYVHRVGRTGRAGRKGTAYTFISSKEEQYAPVMERALIKAGQSVPAELASMCTAFKEKVEKGEAHWCHDGFNKTKGYTFDANEMNETQKIASMQKRQYEIEQGLISADSISAAAAAENEVEEEAATAIASKSTASVPGSGDGDSGALPVPAPAAAGPSAAELAAMTPLEKAKALAASLATARLRLPASAGGITSAGSSSSSSSSSSSGVGVGGAINAQAALARAKLIAQQMAGGGGGGGAASSATGADADGIPKAPAHFSDELEINDYPAMARRKVTQKNVMDDICEKSGVAVISRGTHVPPGKKIEAGERKLHLLIEGSSEMGVRQAKLEILRQLEEETMRIGVSVANSVGGGRYSVM